MRVTVAICTWNRAKLLDQTLSEMHRLRVPEGTEWELLIVNNNCTDTTDTVIARHASNLPIRRLFEANLGHSSARNCAVSQATGNLLLWTDDDVIVNRDWMIEYVRAARQWPDATFFSGPIEPWFAIEPPKWIMRNIELKALQGCFALQSIGHEIRRLAADEFPVGANMAFRTSVLRQNPFDPCLGRVGKSLVGCDETSLAMRLKNMGHCGIWVGTARVKHYIPAERLTLQYVWRWHRGNGQSTVRMEGVPKCALLWRAPRWAWKLYWKSLFEAVIRFPAKDSSWLAAYTSAAYYKGFLEEAREMMNPL